VIPCQKAQKDYKKTSRQKEKKWRGVSKENDDTLSQSMYSRKIEHWLTTQPSCKSRGRRLSGRDGNLIVLMRDCEIYIDPASITNHITTTFGRKE